MVVSEKISLGEHVSSRVGEKWRGGMRLGMLALLLAVLLLGGEGGLYTPARRIGYAVCHQIPSHSYKAWEHPLPLCARCTGQYLGALVMLGYMLWIGGTQVQRLPSPGALGVIGALLGIWAVDGLNSYLDFFGLPHAYAPHNFLRLMTGMGEGVSIVALFWPLFAQATWPPRGRARLRARELPPPLIVAYALALAVHFGDGQVRYTLGVLSTLGVFLLMSMVFSVFLRLLTQRVGKNASGWETGAFLIGGGIIALGVILGVGALRDLLPPIAVE